MDAYADRKAHLLGDLAAVSTPDEMAVGLGKTTSNLFREREHRRPPKIDLRHFNHVVSVQPDARTVEAEGMITYADLADATLAQGVMPCVVPQLKSITLGGAVAGVGIESSSFKYGLVHETVQSIDVLTAGGHVLTCTPDNDYSDLFFGFPNSYGTLGYALKATSYTVPVRPYVKLEHVRYDDPARCFADIARHCEEQTLDFLDGTVFDQDEMFLTLGRFVDDAPYTSDYTFERIYYRSLRENAVDYLATRDYLWRWDTDWFWCSRQVGAQHPLLRRLLGRERLNSVTYQKIMRWNTRWRLTRTLNWLQGIRTESVIQDVDIPIQNAAQFLDFLLREIGVLPVWLCPIKSPHAGMPYPLYPLRGDTVYVNFGFWDVVRDRSVLPPGYYNRQIERMVAQLGGIKSLYSDSYYTPQEFWSAYNHGAYDRLKRRYDPRNLLPDLYAKTVLRL
jgi:FAD/FMN-containing dehydrogenase